MAGQVESIQRRDVSDGQSAAIAALVDQPLADPVDGVPIRVDCDDSQPAGGHECFGQSTVGESDDQAEASIDFRACQDVLGDRIVWRLVPGPRIRSVVEERVEFVVGRAASGLSFAVNQGDQVDASVMQSVESELVCGGGCLAGDGS